MRAPADDVLMSYSFRIKDLVGRFKSTASEIDHEQGNRDRTITTDEVERGIQARRDEVDRWDPERGVHPREYWKSAGRLSGAEDLHYVLSNDPGQATDKIGYAKETAGHVLLAAVDTIRWLFRRS